jgi:hypothetical protein
MNEKMYIRNYEQKYMLVLPTFDSMNQKKYVFHLYNSHEEALKSANDRIQLEEQIGSRIEYEIVDETFKSQDASPIFGILESEKDTHAFTFSCMNAEKLYELRLFLTNKLSTFEKKGICTTRILKAETGLTHWFFTRKKERLEVMQIFLELLDSFTIIYY